jgi:hypothetical protein
LFGTQVEMFGTARALFMDDSDEENMGDGSWLCTLCSPGHNQVSNHLSHCPQCGVARHTAGGWDANELVPLSRMPSISVDSDLHRLPLMDIQNRPAAHESGREPVAGTRAPNSKDLSAVLVWMGVHYGVIQGETTAVRGNRQRAMRYIAGLKLGLERSKHGMPALLTPTFQRRCQDAADKLDKPASKRARPANPSSGSTARSAVPARAAISLVRWVKGWSKTCEGARLGVRGAQRVSTAAQGCVNRSPGVC